MPKNYSGSNFHPLFLQPLIIFRRSVVPDALGLNADLSGRCIGRKCEFSKGVSKVLNRRVVRVVEGARLESVYARKGIEGSNPSLSA